MATVTTQRLLAALALAAMFAAGALASGVEGQGGEGTFQPATFGASVDYDPNAPDPAPLPPGTFQYK